MPIETQDLRDLETAVELLESPSFVAKLSDVIGEPIDKVVSGLPAKASKKVDDVVHSALISLRNLAGSTLGDARPRPASTIASTRFFAATPAEIRSRSRFATTWRLPTTDGAAWAAR